MSIQSAIAGTGTYTPITFVTSASERMRIDTSGNVGIGTSSPSFTNGAGLFVERSGNAAAIEVNRSDASIAGSVSLLGGTAQNTIYSVGAKPLTFVTNSTERMRIDSSGNVGIGTTSPAFTFGSGVRIDRTGDTAILELSRTDAGIAGSFLIASGSVSNTMRSNGAKAITIFTDGSERMRIDSSGNLFIGTTTNPVSNAVAIINAVVSSGDGFNLKHTVNGNNMFNLWQTGTTTYVALSFSKGDTQTVRGSISVSTSSVSYNTGSDYRLKENIEPMVGALNTVSQLKPVTYTWKESGSDGQGFIAHELAEVVPDCVSGEKDAVDEEGKPIYQGIDTSFLVATLTAAIQELKAELDVVKSELNTLKGN
jgi:hypothetical protein